MKTALESDVSTLDGILRASYEVLSGPAGQARDWERHRTLFVDGARLMPVVAPIAERPGEKPAGKSGEEPREESGHKTGANPGARPHVRQLTVDDYIRRVEPIFAVENFWERETSREVEIIGRVAHVLSRYESLRDPNGPPFETGANSMQLFFDDTRWWIVSVMWNTSRSA
jgi:hypothetical protein